MSLNADMNLTQRHRVTEAQRIFFAMEKIYS